MYNADPREYYNLISDLKSGKFDKIRPSDTDSIKSDEWFSHFSSLLGRTIVKSEEDICMDKYIEMNIDNFSDLDFRFTKIEILKYIKQLKNNKATSFDGISNEMLKASSESLVGPLLLLFNTCLKHNLYPTIWRKDILGPLHKSSDKTDPNNFRGIMVGSCLAKLFHLILHGRLVDKCKSENSVNKFQLSGKENVRTSDHLLVLKHVINKYLKVKKQKLFVCYFDIKKAFDFVNRTKLFYTLLKDFGIGGKYLKMFKNIYSDNQTYIKLSNGLTKPFKTTTGVAQGKPESPLFFNLLIDKLPTVYDSLCDPVMVNNCLTNCLIWADDCVVMSTTQSGLQRAIDKTVQFFKNQGLTVNTKKNQSNDYEQYRPRALIIPKYKVFY